MFAFLTGVDFFISYSRKDEGASAYALELANELRKKGLTTYIDQYGSEPGKNIPHTLLRKLKQSRVLVVLAGKNSIASDAVDHEIKTFVGTGRPIVTIDFDQVETAKWYLRIEGLAISRQSPAAILQAPDASILNRIVSSFTYSRQLSRIRYSVIGSVLIFLVAGVALFFLVRQLSQQGAQLKELDLNLAAKEREIQTADSLLIENEEKVKQTEASLASVDSALKQQQQKLNTVNEQLTNTQLLKDNRDEYINQLTKLVMDNAFKPQAEPPPNPLVSAQFWFEMGRSVLRQSEVRSEPGKTLDAAIATFSHELKPIKIDIIMEFGIEVSTEKNELIPVSQLEAVAKARYESMKQFIIKRATRYNPEYVSKMQFVMHLRFTGSRKAFVYISEQ